MTPPAERHWSWALPLLPALPAGLYLLRLAHGVLPLPPCVFRTLTGYPCLTCGGTHALLALAALDVAAALGHNPLVTLSVGGLLVASALGALEVLLRRPLLPPRLWLHRRWWVVAILALANWVYLLSGAWE